MGVALLITPRIFIFTPFGVIYPCSLPTAVGLPEIPFSFGFPSFAAQKCESLQPVNLFKMESHVKNILISSALTRDHRRRIFSCRFPLMFQDGCRNRRNCFTTGQSCSWTILPRVSELAPSQPYLTMIVTMQVFL